MKLILFYAIYIIMSNKRSQNGGAIRMPNRWFNEQGNPFKPCDSCTGCVKGEQGQGQGQEGGSIGMPYRWFNADATPYKPCANSNPYAIQSEQSLSGGGTAAYDYYNDFGCPNCQEYDSCYSNKVNPRCQEERSEQRGGNPTGAPLYVFTEGAPLKFSNPMIEGPKFYKVGANKFWLS